MYGSSKPSNPKGSAKYMTHSKTNLNILKQKQQRRLMIGRKKCTRYYIESKEKRFCRLLLLIT